MTTVPFPSGADDLADRGITWRPAKLVDDSGRGGDQDCRVTGSATYDLVGYRPADGLLAGLQHFEDSCARARPEVVGPSHAWRDASTAR